MNIQLLRATAGLSVWSVAMLAAMAQPPKPQPMSTSIKGKFHSFQGDVVRVVVDEKQGWQLRVTKNAVVVVKGQGGPEILRPGMPVRLYANLTRKGRAVEPVKQLEVFTPEEGLQPVVIEEPEQPEAEDQEPSSNVDDSEASPPDSQSGGSEQEPEEQPAASKDRGSKRPRREQARPDPPTKRFFVVGTLTSLKKGKFVIAVGRQRVQGQLAKDAVVKIESNDYRITRPGDTVEAKSVRYYRPGQGQTNDLTITLNIRPVEEKSP